MSKLFAASRFFGTAILLAMGVSAAHAVSLSAAPIIITLDGKSTSAVTIRNEGTEPRVVQTELVQWTQRSGQNSYTSTRDLLLNPPIFTLNPGQSQIVRVGLNRKADNAQELAYRLYFTEVLGPPKPDFNGLRIALRLDMPVFVSPKARPSVALSWQAQRAADGALQLTMHNTGNVHALLHSLSVTDAATGQRLAELKQAQPTLLAGQARQISLMPPAAWQGGSVKVAASTDSGTVESTVAVRGR